MTAGSIEVEFFGIARQRALQPSATVEVDGTARLVEVLFAVSKQLPGMVPDCIVDGRLCKTCTANLNGDRFLADSSSVIQPGDRLLIMSADAGG